MIYVPGRGDLITVNFNPQVGHEQSGRRPALVVSPKEYNLKSGLALICSITSKVKNYPFEVPIPPNLPIRGVVLADQLKSVDWKGRQAQLVHLFDNECLEFVYDVLARIETLIS
nr:mRNA-degrading endonuclease [Bacilli bacterium]